MSRHLVCLSLDFDTVALWLALGKTTPTAISRGEFGAVAAERLLRLFSDLGIHTTWFIPGITADTYAPICRQIAEQGHEIGHHGYDHIAPGSLDRDAELEQLKRGNEAIVNICGQAARGYRSPAWDLSANSVELLIEQGFVYDSSMMGHDTQPYRARIGDVAVPGKPLQFGRDSQLWELPISWSTDDFPHFEHFRGGGLSAGRDVLENWLDDFLYMQQSTDWGVLTYTLHPFVIGRGHRMKMLATLLRELLDYGALFVTAEQAISEFQRLPTPPQHSG